MSLNNLAAKTKQIIAATPWRALGENICSQNTKTGWSINFNITQTCHPTKMCSEYCYGAMSDRPITWKNSITKYVRNYNLFRKTDPQLITNKIYKEYIARHMTFLRWNGVGDLFPESTDVMNRLVTQHPDAVVWCSTRNVGEVRKCSREATNLYLMFSLDNTLQSRQRKAIMDAIDHPRVYYSFLRTEENDDCMGARIVFNLQQKKDILPFDDERTVCPVDSDRMPVKGACKECRRCFNSTTLEDIKHESQM